MAALSDQAYRFAHSAYCYGSCSFRIRERNLMIGQRGRKMGSHSLKKNSLGAQQVTAGDKGCPGWIQHTAKQEEMDRNREQHDGFHLGFDQILEALDHILDQYTGPLLYGFVDRVEIFVESGARYIGTCYHLLNGRRPALKMLRIAFHHGLKKPGHHTLPADLRDAYPMIFADDFQYVRYPYQIQDKHLDDGTPDAKAKWA